MKKLTILITVLLLVACAPTATLKPVSQEVAGDKYVQLQRIQAKILPLIDKENSREYRVVIADSPQVNAFSQCSDYRIVVVLMGALDTFSYDEMHFIMAHEYSHIALKHCQSTMAVSTTISLLRFIPFGGLANLIVNPLVTKAYSRANEYEADKNAVNVLIAIGMDPRLAIDALEKLKTIALTKEMSQADRTGLLDTHPNLTARIEAIRKQITNIKPVEVPVSLQEKEDLN